jgi:hypothetical protein
MTFRVLMRYLLTAFSINDQGQIVGFGVLTSDADAGTVHGLPCPLQQGLQSTTPTHADARDPLKLPTLGRSRAPLSSSVKLRSSDHAETLLISVRKARKEPSWHDVASAIAALCNWRSCALCLVLRQARDR